MLAHSPRLKPTDDAAKGCQSNDVICIRYNDLYVCGSNQEGRASGSNYSGIGEGPIFVRPVGRKRSITSMPGMKERKARPRPAEVRAAHERVKIPFPVEFSSVIVPRRFRQDFYGCA